MCNSCSALSCRLAQYLGCFQSQSPTFEPPLTPPLPPAPPPCRPLLYLMCVRWCQHASSYLHFHEWKIKSVYIIWVLHSHSVVLTFKYLLNCGVNIWGPDLESEMKQKSRKNGREERILRYTRYRLTHYLHDTISTKSSFDVCQPSLKAGVGNLSLVSSH